MTLHFISFSVGATIEGYSDVEQNYRKETDKMSFILAEKGGTKA